MQFDPDQCSGCAADYRILQGILDNSTNIYEDFKQSQIGYMNGRRARELKVVLPCNTSVVVDRVEKLVLDVICLSPGARV